VSGGLEPIRGAKIAHLIETDGPGGAERVLAQLAGDLASEGCPGVAFLPRQGEGWLGRELEAAGVVVDHFHLERPLSPACARDLAAAFRRHNVSLAHSHEFTMAVYGACAAWFAGIPHVVTMHGSRYYAERWRRRLALRVSLDISGGVVAVSRPLAEHLSRDLHFRRGRVTVIPNGVRPRPHQRSTLREELGLRSQAPLLLSVGNLYKVKGHRFLIEALATLRHELPDVHVAIAGRGVEEGGLRELAISRGVGERVHLLGLRGDVPNLLAAADIFVMPSLSEGLPLALLEAMFAALPVVASDVGEIATVLDEGSAGVLVRPGDSEALAGALRTLLRDRVGARKLGERAARRAASEYDLRSTVARYAGVYAAVLGRGPLNESRSCALTSG
jgi:glycosyltransferase involved in cell wall biosynthesis